MFSGPTDEFRQVVEIGVEINKSGATSQIGTPSRLTIGRAVAQTAKTPFSMEFCL
jgi:hypothetical protein